MTDKFDPDRMNSSDVDPRDPEAVQAWLDHPNTQALHDDLGRAFREEPAAAQRPLIERYIAETEPKLAEVRQMAAQQQDPEVRAALDALRATMEEGIASARRRLAELT